jgi:hypothetical protein
MLGARGKQVCTRLARPAAPWRRSTRALGPICDVCATAMTGPQLSAELSWLSVTRTYEGFPLYLRYPVGVDYNALAPLFPVHLTVVHEFSLRRVDGAPEPRYNETLEAFDLEVVRYFATSGEGCPVLVETFGGKRNYYFYAKESVDPQAVVAELQARFPGQRLTTSARSDPTWKFISRYAKEFLNGV